MVQDPTVKFVTGEPQLIFSSTILNPKFEYNNPKYGAKSNELNINITAHVTKKIIMPHIIFLCAFKM